MEADSVVDLGRQPRKEDRKNKHISSVVQPDTLFHFESKCDYLIEMLERKSVAPRYCKENLRYLNLKGVKEIAFPMSCFCDIGLQKLDHHMRCYGYYGIAFPKKWCIDHHFHPVQYLNKGSRLAIDMKLAFNGAMKAVSESMSKTEEALSNYLLHQLLYSKPYSGRQKFRVDGKRRDKCFSDECEWRFIPEANSLTTPLIVSGQWELDTYILSYNQLLKANMNAAVRFEYEDLKYVILKDTNDYSELLSAVENWRDEEKITEEQMFDILSKVLVWEEVKGDF